MKAFHNDPKIKTKYLKRVNAHMKADEIIKGQYWQDGKGCAVGCTIHGAEHAKYETELGIPEWLARVEDTLFEGLPNDRAKTWPKEFLSAIKPGANLEKTKNQFTILVLNSNLVNLDNCVYNEEEYPKVKEAISLTRAAIKQMIAAFESNDETAKSAAESAAWSAAWSAAESARSAAESAWSAAESAAWSAWSAAESAAWSARSAARSAKYVYFADELLKLLKRCKS